MTFPIVEDSVKFMREIGWIGASEATPPRHHNSASQRTKPPAGKDSIGESDEGFAPYDYSKHAADTAPASTAGSFNPYSSIKYSGVRGTLLAKEALFINLTLLFSHEAAVVVEALLVVVVVVVVVIKEGIVVQLPVEDVGDIDELSQAVPRPQRTWSPLVVAPACQANVAENHRRGDGKQYFHNLYMQWLL